MVPEEFKLKTVSTSQYLDLPSPSFKKQDEATLKDRKIFTNREDKKQAYHEFKTLFKTVAEDIGIL